MRFHLIVVWFHLKLCTKKEGDCFGRWRERGIWLGYVRLLSLPFLYGIWSTPTNLKINCVKKLTIPRLIINLYLRQVSRILKTRKVIEWGFNCQNFFPYFVFTSEHPSLFTGIVCKFHVHVHNMIQKSAIRMYRPRSFSHWSGESS